MKSSFLPLLLLCAAGCEERSSLQPTGRQPRDYALAAPNAFPTAQEIERACFEAIAVAIRDAPGIVHPTYYDYPVRTPQCRWAEEEPRTADCRFEQSTVAIEFPTGEQREEALRHMKSRDWEVFRATLVRAQHRWVAPAGCHRWRAEEDG